MKVAAAADDDDAASVAAAAAAAADDDAASSATVEATAGTQTIDWVMIITGRIGSEISSTTTCCDQIVS